MKSTASRSRWAGYASYLSFPPLKFEDIPGGTLASWEALPQAGWAQIVALIAILDNSLFAQDPRCDFRFCKVLSSWYRDLQIQIHRRRNSQRTFSASVMQWNPIDISSMVLVAGERARQRGCGEVWGPHPVGALPEPANPGVQAQRRAQQRPRRDDGDHRCSSRPNSALSAPQS